MTEDSASMTAIKSMGLFIEELETKNNLLQVENRHLNQTLDDLTHKLERAKFLLDVIEELLQETPVNITHFQRETINSVIIHKIKKFKLSDDILPGF